MLCRLRRRFQFLARRLAKGDLGNGVEVVATPRRDEPTSIRGTEPGELNARARWRLPSTEHNRDRALACRLAPIDVVAEIKNRRVIRRQAISNRAPVEVFL